MGIVPGLTDYTLKKKRLICGCRLHYHFVSIEQGANKVLRWTHQLVMRKSGFHFFVWFKFFIIKISEEGEKGNQDFWRCCFQKKKPTFVLSWRIKSIHTWDKKYTVNSCLILANQLDTSAVQFPPHTDGVRPVTANGILSPRGQAAHTSSFFGQCFVFPSDAR